MTIESKSLIKADLDSCEKISFGKRLGRPRWSALRIIAETQIEYQGGGLLGSGRVTGNTEVTCESRARPGLSAFMRWVAN
jgi:hypothetical protein